MRVRILLLGALVFSGATAPLAEGPIRQAGPYEVTLHAPPDGLYAGEEMELEFRVTDARGSAAEKSPVPVLFARFQCDVDMPSMPSMGRFEEIAHREGVPGVYGVHPTFPHGGDYRFCITLLPPAEQLAMNPRPDAPFTVEFPLEVADASASPRPASSRNRPYRLEAVSAPSAPAAGEPAELELRVRLENSPDLREVTDFDLVHEKPMHLFLVRRDLAYFAHEHPEVVSPGVFRLRYRFPAPGEYRLFADVAPRDAGSQVLATSLRVQPGAGATPPPSAMPSGPVLSAESDGVRVQIEIPDGGIPAGKTILVGATLSRREGAAGRRSRAVARSRRAPAPGPPGCRDLRPRAPRRAGALARARRPDSLPRAPAEARPLPRLAPVPAQRPNRHRGDRARGGSGLLDGPGVR